MGERGLRAELACFEGVWTDLGGLRLLLLRAKSRRSLDLELPEEALRLGATRGSIDPDAVPSSLRRLPGLADLRRECDFGHVELLVDGIQLSLVFAGRRTRCLPLASLPDRVTLIELFLRGVDSDVLEFDAVQRSALTKRSLKPGEDLYTACLVGEVLDSNIVALGVELLNSGYRTILAEELKQTRVEKRPGPDRPERPKKISKKRKKKRRSS